MSNGVCHCRGRIEEAAIILRDIAKVNGEKEPKDLERRLDKISRHMREEKVELQNIQINFVLISNFIIGLRVHQPLVQQGTAEEDNVHRSGHHRQQLHLRQPLHQH